MCVCVGFWKDPTNRFLNQPLEEDSISFYFLRDRCCVELKVFVTVSIPTPVYAV